MSYCRFSTNDFSCDLYIYESAEGYVTHVALNRIVFERPLPAPVPHPPKDAPVTAWTAHLQRHTLIHDIVRASLKLPIGGPCDGQTFTDATLDDLLARVRGLIADGYVCPDAVVTAIALGALEEIGRGDDAP